MKLPTQSRAIRQHRTTSGPRSVEIEIGVRLGDALLMDGSDAPSLIRCKLRCMAIDETGDEVDLTLGETHALLIDLID